MTIRTTNPIERLNKEFKRRTRATDGEQAIYRIMIYVAITIEYNWSCFQFKSWASALTNRSSVYTHDVAWPFEHAGTGVAGPTA